MKKDNFDMVVPLVFWGAVVLGCCIVSYVLYSIVF